MLASVRVRIQHGELRSRNRETPSFEQNIHPYTNSPQRRILLEVGNRTKNNLALVSRDNFGGVLVHNSG